MESKTGTHHAGSSIDFTQLQREYRNMEMNRKMYSDESHQVMRRQQTVIEKLKRDNEDMKNELALATRHITESSATAQQESINRMQDQIDTFVKKIAAEAKHSETLAQQITIMKHKVLHQKKHMGGVNASKENQHMVNKQIRILENRLDKSLVKFNEALAQNKILREEIDNLRRERMIFDNIYRKLEKDHNERKKQMANIIELSNLSYEQRDSAQMEIKAIEQVNRQESEEHRRQIAELLDKMEESKRRADQAREAQIRESQRRESGDDSSGALRRKLQRQQWGVAKDKVHVQVSVERVQNYEEVFAKIKAATGITDIEELVTTFIKNEDQNFSLFNYVNEQTNEIEKLQDQIEALKIEEAKYSEESGDDVHQHKQLLKELESKLAATEHAAEKYESKYNETQKNINAVKIAIQVLFSKVGCNANAMCEMLGDNIVTEVNMMQYLGMVEQRTNEILQLYAQYQQKRNAPVDVPSSTTLSHGASSHQLHAVLGLGPTAPMGGEPLQINPPNLEDYSSDEEENIDQADQMHPLSRDELKVKTLKNLRRGSAPPMHTLKKQTGTSKK
ncbi:Coiled-coil domain-containing protein 63 [Aphanomyces cochlioides]|nr:Coiled-coil domain-containing protein 63 [Aphanomyces cochlioides]